MIDWQDKIRKDIVPFANSGTKLKCKENGENFEVTWKARNRELNALFAKEENKIIVTFEGTTIDYYSFLASPSMSDVLGIAGMILQMHQSSVFVDTKAKNPEDEGDPQSAISLLNDAVRNQAEGSTNVLFINADAGAGKTEVLKQLVYEQATKYIKGDATFLYLYVNAQGRALAKLEEALATEIQDLRASSLTYHVVPTLTRNRILVPIIDGFDELLGVMGYEDSFSSLRRFLSSLDGEGCLIASARSTYYQQEFLSRANRSSSGLGGITINQIDIHPWQDEEFSDYLEKKYQHSYSSVSFPAFRAAMTDVFSAEKNSALKTKPFFLSAAANLLLEGVSISQDDLIDQLVKGFIERERSEKLLDKNNNPLLSHEQIHFFLKMVSEEMWAGEVRFLDRETIKDIADLSFDALTIGSDVVERLQERAGTMAFFTASMHREGIEFEHQLFFSYFLGETIASVAVKDQVELFRIFVRATLPEGAASFAARKLVSSGQSATNVINNCNGAAGRGSVRPPHLSENAGSLIAEFLRENNTEGFIQTYDGQTFKDIVFAGIQFPCVNIFNSFFNDVEFKRSDLSKLKLFDCVGDGLIFQDITVNPDYTLIKVSGISLENNLFGLRIRNEDRIKPLFRVDDIKIALAKCAFPGTEQIEPVGIDDNILQLLEKLFRKLDKSNVFWPTDEANKNITQDTNWDKIASIFISSGLAVRERVSSQSGVPRHHLRVTASSESIILGQNRSGKTPENITKFWDEIRKKWPSQ